MNMPAFANLTRGEGRAHQEFLDKMSKPLYPLRVTHDQTNSVAKNDDRNIFDNGDIFRAVIGVGTPPAKSFWAKSIRAARAWLPFPRCFPTRKEWRKMFNNITHNFSALRTFEQLLNYALPFV